MMNIYYKNAPYIPVEDIPKAKKILSRLSLSKIDEDYNHFKRSCHTSPNIKNNINRFLDNLFATEYGQLHFKLLIELRPFDPITYIADPAYYFRIRIAEKIDNIDKEQLIVNDKGIYDDLQFEEMNCLSHVWMRPNYEITRYDRLNKPGQQVLYTSLDGSIPILETGVAIGEWFFMIIYKRVTPLCYFSDCVRFIAYNELTDEENMKRYIMFNHLRNEFTRVFPATYDQQSQYCISSAIAEHFFIADNVIGLQYPSVKGLGYNNFAFFGDKAKESLTPVCVKLCRLEEQYDKVQTKVKMFFNGFWINDKFVWTSPDSSLSTERKDQIMEMYLYK